MTRWQAHPPTLTSAARRQRQQRSHTSISNQSEHSLSKTYVELDFTVASAVLCHQFGTYENFRFTSLPLTAPPHQQDKRFALLEMKYTRRVHHVKAKIKIHTAGHPSHAPNNQQVAWRARQRRWFTVLIIAKSWEIF